MKIYRRAILPLGFKASGISCGLKRSGKKDLALIYSFFPARAACLFTTNKVKAAPVVLCKQVLKKSRKFQAIIANSGNANCLNGIKGYQVARRTASSLARALGLREDNVLVASTGIIARAIPFLKIKRGLPDLVKGLSTFGISEAQKAIMTTDTFPKGCSAKFNLNGREVTICGIAKGAGMIAPDMATLLVFISTDANIKAGYLRKALKKSVDGSFNCITVDGCMSTNDSVMCLANAAAGNVPIGEKNGFEEFSRALDLVCLELAKMIVRDAEGAGKFIEIRVSQAIAASDARRAALAIANSNLFKTACYGENPNFGRIASAVGSSGAGFKEGKLKIRVSSLKRRNILVRVSLGAGIHSAVVYTSDLTPEYIKINAQYN